MVKKPLKMINKLLIINRVISYSLLTFFIKDADRRTTIYKIQVHGHLNIKQNYSKDNVLYKGSKIKSS